MMDHVVDPQVRESQGPVVIVDEKTYEDVQGESAEKFAEQVKEIIFFLIFLLLLFLQQVSFLLLLSLQT